MAYTNSKHNKIMSFWSYETLIHFNSGYEWEDFFQTLCNVRSIDLNFKIKKDKIKVTKKK